MNTAIPYIARRPSTSRFETVRGLRYHLRCWGDASLVTPERPPLVMTHGWMDMGASYQFVVDALADADGFQRYVIAPDWRGFGLSAAPLADSYWFPDYLGDLDTLLDLVSPGAPVDLLGHSMGGNVVMSYAGVRPQRVRRLVNVEGFGMPATKPHHAPKRLALWLDELKAPAQLRPYPDLAAVAARLQANDPLLSARQGGLAGPALGPPRVRRQLGTAGRPGAQAHQPRAVPGGRGAGDLEKHHRPAAVGGRRPDRHRQVVGPPLFARRIPRALGGCAHASAQSHALTLRPHAAPRPARGPGRRVGGASVLSPPHAKIAGFVYRASMMDIEHVNSIGTLLADLSNRTQQLRGYL